MEKFFQPKLFSILKNGYGKKAMSQDVLAGIVVGIVALPLAIAFAIASGVSPEKGLITAVVAGFIISFLGGSRVQIGGPTGAYIVIVYAIIEKYGFNGLLISTIMAGFILMLFGFLRLGSLLKFFPQPLIIGFTSGIALTIFSTQIKDAMGMGIEKVPSEFADKWMCYFNHLDTINPWAVGVTLISILITIYTSKITQKIPGSFLAIILVSVGVYAFDVPVSNIETFFGEIPNKISLTMPHFEFAELPTYFAPAITIALLGGIESLLSAVVADGMISGNHRSNTELITQGFANIVTPFFGGIPATGAIARTATNVKNGGRSPIAGMVHAITLLMIMLFFGKWAKLIPMSCLAGILIVVSYNMSEWRNFISILKGSFFDILVLVTTFLLTVFVDLSIAIQIGVVLSALLFMKRMADISKTYDHEIDTDVIPDYSNIPKDVKVFEISGPFFFGSAKQYSQVIQSSGTHYKTLIIRMRHVPFMDATGIHNFNAALKQLQKNNTRIVLSGVNEEVRKELKRGGIEELIGKENIYTDFKEACKNS